MPHKFGINSPPSVKHISRKAFFKHALVVVSKKVLTLIFTLSKKKVYYEAERVFGSYRKSQLQAA